ncbi:merlin-like [Cloeon dipterum]|uniref:merlin-like n=1 Tax=Cloeon dipterum TaxID=197152 RepID=UPI00322061F1
MPFRKGSKRFPVKLTTLTDELDSKATGRALLELACQLIGLREVWYFGLQLEKAPAASWMHMDKRVRDQVKAADQPGLPVRVVLLAKLYPENVAEELLQEITQHLFFLQVKQAILWMDIYCPPETSVLLALYAVQAQYGDYDDQTYQPGMISGTDLLPHRAISQYQMTPQMWEERIKTWHADHRSMAFAWTEIRNVSYEDKRFTIKPVDKSASNFVFHSTKVKMNKLNLDLCVGNHDMFMRRRKPDTVDVQQMKAQARDEKIRRQIERNKLAKEKQLREAAERDRSTLEERLLQYQEEIRLANEALHRSEETAELLAEKSRVAEEEAMLLSQKAAEAEQEVS